MSNFGYIGSHFKLDARRRTVRTVSMICEEEPLSDVQIKSFQTRLQEYRTFLEAVSRLASAGNICTTEEAVGIGENGLLTGEALNALQHAGAISVYNTLQQNNWHFPLPENCEVVIPKHVTAVADEFLDSSDTPIRSDWPAVHISECFIDGEKASLRGPVRPLRTYLPPGLAFRNPADLDEELPETEVQAMQKHQAAVGGFELVSTNSGVKVRMSVEESREMELVPLSQYYFGRSDGSDVYHETKGSYRFRCNTCGSILHNNVKFMFHILGHVDDKAQNRLNFAELNQCRQCMRIFGTPFEMRMHMEEEHQRPGPPLESQHTFGMSSAMGYVWECLICGTELGSEMLLAQHLHSAHKHKEMPYGCKLCAFRSSIYEDVLDHFKKVHVDSGNVLCVYCFRVFQLVEENHGGAQKGDAPQSITHLTDCSAQAVSTYLNHLNLHQSPTQCRRCPACKLSFTNKSEYHIHRKLEHKATPALTVKTEVFGGTKEQVIYTPGEQQVEIAQVDLNSKLLDHQDMEPLALNAPCLSHVTDLSHLRVPIELKDSTCLECALPLDTKDHQQYLPCSECCFATCCSRAFARHARSSHPNLFAMNHFTGDPAPFTRRANNILHKLSASTESSLPMDGIEIVDLDAVDTKPVVTPTKKETSAISEYHCGRCGLSSMNGNTLASHMVEVCGAHEAVLTPDEALLTRMKAREVEAEAEKRRQKEVVKMFEAPSESATSSAQQPQQAAAGEGQYFQVQTETGEVQTFMLPDGFQLQEGQSLVIVEGEDGQPQLAVVNQDFITDNADDQMLIATTGNEGDVVLFSEDVEHGFMH